jgi:hypothetical protein
LHRTLEVQTLTSALNWWTLEVERGGKDMTTVRTQSLTGCYIARFQGVDCRLELNLDHTACLAGAFIADGEGLKIMGGAPNTYNEVFGLILEPSGNIMAVFRAALHAQDLILEVDVPRDGDLMHLGNVERVTFKRLPLDE